MVARLVARTAVDSAAYLVALSVDSKDDASAGCWAEQTVLQRAV